MRLKDREIVGRSEIDKINRGCVVCHLGLAVDGEPYFDDFTLESARIWRATVETVTGKRSEQKAT